MPFLSKDILASQRWDWHDRVFHNYTVNDGLPNGAISAIAEDSIGFIWLWTSEGLARFDGHHFEYVYSPLLTSNSVNVIRLGAKGMLWLGTNKGLIEFDPATRQFKRHELAQNKPASITDIAINSDDNSSIIWVSTNDIVFEYNTQSSATQSFTLASTPLDKPWRTFDLLFANDNALWLATNHGLFYKEAHQTQFSLFDLSNELPSNNRISTVLQDRNGIIWVGTPAAGVVTIDAQLNVSQLHIPDFTNEWVYSMTEVSPGIVWLGTYGRGIIEMSVDGSTGARIENDRLNQRSIVSNEIWQLYTSQSGLVWVGSSRGVSMYDTTQKSVISLFGDTSRSNGISDTNINAILEDSTGKIWLGLRQKGIDIIEPSLGKVKHLAIDATNPENALPVGAIESLATAKSGKIIIGSNWGVYTHEQSTLKRLTVKGRSDKAYSGVVKTFDDVILAGGTDGLWKIDNGKSPNAAALNLSHEFDDIRTTAVLKLSPNEYAVGTWQGLVWIDGQGKLTYQLSQEHNVLASSFVSSILKDQQQRLWVSTEGNGIFVGESGEYPQHFSQLTKAQGLSSNVVRSMQTDDNGNVWASTSAGIDVINIESLSVQSLKSYDGVLFAPYYRQAALKTTHGELIFGGRNGMTIIDPELWQQHSSFSRLAVTSTQYGDIANFDSKLGIKASTPIIIAADRNELSVKFSSLDFAATSIKYRYRLLGLNEQWQERSDNNRVAAFTTLPPGDYQLEIQSSNRLGQWNPDSHMMHIRVMPFWYQTLWAKITALLFIGLLVWLSVKARTARLQKRQDFLEQEVKKRTLSLQKVSDELATMSMTDPLTGIKNRRYLDQAMQYETTNVLEKYQQLTGESKRVDGSDLVFILIDIDHFKRVNDKYGHQSGDTVLIEITNRIRLIARETDHLIRWGGEEFLLIVRESSIARAEVIAERLRQKIKETAIQLNKSTELKVTCSIGLCAFPLFARAPDNIDWLKCVNLADKALYSAKNSGRDTWISVKENESLLSDEIPTAFENIDHEHVKIDSNLEQSRIDAHWKFS